MSLFRDILYGFVSGFAEFLPVSSLGHQSLMRHLFGWESVQPIRDLLVHIALIIALLTACRPSFDRLNREKKMMLNGRRMGADRPKDGFDLHLIRTASVPLVIGSLLCFYTLNSNYSLAMVSLFFVLNGLIMIVPDHVRSSNKDSRSMTGLDGIVLGIVGALSVFPGVSRTGAMYTFASARGVGKSHAINWVLLLSLPALIVLCGYDFISIFIFSGTGFSFLALIGCLVSAIAAYCGGYLSIALIRFLTYRTGYDGFAYYSWGAALLSMILYLIT